MVRRQWQHRLHHAAVVPRRWHLGKLSTVHSHHWLNDYLLLFCSWQSWNAVGGCRRPFRQWPAGQWHTPCI